MRRLAISLCMWTATALALCSTGPAYAQAEQPAATPPGGEAPAEPPAAEPPAVSPDAAVAAEVRGAQTPMDAVKSQGERYRDIMVLPRRPVLKAKRVEFTPLYQFNFNSPLIRNHGVGGQLNYYLSEALWLGVEGNYYFNELSNNATGTYFLSASQTKVFPPTNKMIFTALLDAGYVPVYGKFALFNQRVIHWEAYVTLGVGAFMSEVVPYDPVNKPGFRNISAIVQVGAGNRLFLTRWLALNTFLKLYMYPDRFEKIPGLARNPGESDDSIISRRSDDASTTLSLDVVFGVGLSFFLPPSFEYRQPR